jgi:hypothetical protein
MSINFNISESYEGVRIYISPEASKEHYKTQELLKGLERVKSRLKSFRIERPFSDLFKELVIIKGENERQHIDKIYGSNRIGTWRAFFAKQSETIVFDVDHFKDGYELLSTLIHEIGHAVHTNFVSKKSSEYISSIGQKFTSAIKTLNTFKDDIEVYYDDDDLCESFKKEAEVCFYDFTDFLDTHLDTLNFSPGESKLSKMAEQITKFYEKSNKFTPMMAVESMIKALMGFMPSEEGVLNEYEFFAECFRKFILREEGLTKNNINMIINAFAMSRAEGKELMQAHKDVRVLKNYLKVVVENILKV